MTTQSVKIYKCIAISFVVFAFVLLLVIAYISMTKTTITVYPQKSEFSSAFDIRAKEVVESREMVEEHIIELETREYEISVSKQFEATGQAGNDSLIVAFVLLVNESNRSQPLIKSTRLLTSDGQLFRLAKDIVLEPGSKVMVEIYPDDLTSVSGQTIEAQRLEIPGLWSGLKDAIYAKVTERFLVDPERMRVVSKEDVQKAHDELIDMLHEKALQEHASLMDTYYMFVLDLNVKQSQTSQQVGDLSTHFDMMMTGSLMLGFVEKEHVMAIANEILRHRLRPNQNLLSYDQKNVTVSFKEWKDQVLTAQIQFKGFTTLAPLSDIIEKKSLTSKRKKEVLEYFYAFPNIDRVEVDIFPSWVRKSSLLPDHIYITISQE